MVVSVASWLTVGLAGLAIMGLLSLLAIWIRIQKLRPLMTALGSMIIPGTQLLNSREIS